jgi:undecaprenyl diphosphate synthase
LPNHYRSMSPLSWMETDAGHRSIPWDVYWGIARAWKPFVRSCGRAGEIGIRYLTLYAFSMENWSRPAKEVDALMRLLDEYLRSELAEMMQHSIRLTTIGDRGFGRGGQDAFRKDNCRNGGQSGDGS